MIEIVEYKREHQPYFEKFNKAWIEKYFCLEPVDDYVLSKPEEAILQKGGFIFMALCDGVVAGTLALKKVADKTYEFTKMAVDEGFRRRGIAEALSYAAIERAKEVQAEEIILYSQTGLTGAILLYNKLGFKEIPLEPGVYKRSNIKMHLSLTKELFTH